MSIGSILRGVVINNQTQKSVLLLALAGLASALFTIATSTLANRAFGFYEGFIFGVAIAAYFVLHEGVRSAGRVVAFVAASTAAYLASVEAAFKAFDHFPAHASTGSSGPDIPLPVFFISGAVGAFIIFGAAFLLFGPRNVTWRSLSRIVLWSGIGGFLGIVGWMLGSLLKRPNAQFFPLFIIWQTGVALSLALLLSRERAIFTAAPHAIPVRRSGKPVAILFFAVIIIFLGWQVSRTTQAQRAQGRRMGAFQKSLAEAPADKNLPPIPPTAPEQALVLEDVGGLFAEKPFVRNSDGRPGSAGKFAPIPPTRSYSVSYVPLKDAPFGTYQPRITAGVEQYPNADWAHYKAKYTATFNPAVGDPKYLVTVTKFQNRIVMDTSMRDSIGHLFFVWPSGNVMVTIRYETKDINEQVLKRYLEKYPSSL